MSEELARRLEGLHPQFDCDLRGKRQTEYIRELERERDKLREEVAWERVTKSALALALGRLHRVAERERLYEHSDAMLHAMNVARTALIGPGHERD